MAAIRQFKKDINFVTSELVVECFTYNYLFPDKNEKELAAIISDGIQMKINLVNKINAARRNKELALNVQMKTLNTEFKTGVESLVERLSSLAVAEVNQ
jgi:hypothetical protein